jgi:hypothetical protein
VIVAFALAALAAWAVPATVVAIARDGYRAVPTAPGPGTHYPVSSRSA